MDVYWLEQTEADLPAEDDWLSTTEAARLNSFRFAKRRADFRLGRWTAKRAVAAYLHAPDRRPALAVIEVRPVPSGAPEVFVANQPADCTISLSHRGGVAACAVAQFGVALGCDLERVDPHIEAIVADFFTPEEQLLVAQVSAADRSPLVALLWSAKESALKAMHTGLRLDTRSVIVSPGGAFGCAGDRETIENEDRPSVWRPLHIRHTDGEMFHGWWQLTGDLVRTMAADPRPNPPVPLLPPLPVPD